MKSNTAVRVLAIVGIVAIILGALLPALSTVQF